MNERTVKEEINIVIKRRKRQKEVSKIMKMTLIKKDKVKERNKERNELKNVSRKKERINK